ncbi:hypothetical protein [Streptomyces millisiae]|uniref:Uncharacterized protein n=1 Tax=Streptomyces millisiae TaxID=3075542 RepID=A0ABU2LNY3_9ACTN|nr:hypothetical protein [Streptomyces sp. DSM 44918]MDT0319291.1 hypothetical protein [Streptomyces sp. DSM 44918]
MPRVNAPIERTLRHASDVTVDDVWAIADFLLPRLDSLQRIHDAATEEHRIAVGLAEVTSVLTLALESEILGAARVLGRGRSASLPGPCPSPAEDERHSQRKLRLTRIQGYWNQLCGIVHPWCESEGYDHARWHKVTFRDMAEEAEYRRLATETGLRPHDEEP